MGGHLADELIVTEHAEAAHEAVVLHTLPPDLQPVGRREIHRLRHVVPVVEAGVVAAREGDDELPGVLVHAVHGHPVGLQHDHVIEPTGFLKSVT